MMKQYNEIKADYQDCLLFYRLGDFYEMFFDDALTASQFLGLTLTGRDCGLDERAPMCGVPFHSAESYIDKLIQGGFKVAICEQMEDPATTKGLVKRGVVRVITAGTIINDETLEAKSNNYLCSIAKFSVSCAISAVDITTGEVSLVEIEDDSNNSKIMSEIARYNPSEIIVDSKFAEDLAFIDSLKIRFNCAISKILDEFYDIGNANRIISEQFGDKYCKIDDDKKVVLASLLAYLNQTQLQALPHIKSVYIYEFGDFLEIDFASRRNLEITSTMRENKKQGSLLGVIDRTTTAMGGRMIKAWLNKPLINVVDIKHRQEAVLELFNNSILRGNLREEMRKLQDIERLAGRLSTKIASPRDLYALGKSLEGLPYIKKHLKEAISAPLAEIFKQFDELRDVCELIKDSIIENPPITVREGGIIKPGFNEEVDKNRNALDNGTEWLAEIEAKEKERTGIKNLKIKFNRVMGYYIEISKQNSDLVPDDYIRKGTLVNAERYITGELKEIENTILGARERNSALEYKIFCEVRDRVLAHNARLMTSARDIAKVDVFCSLAEVAEACNYVCPSVNNGDKIEITDGRHAVVESVMGFGNFVPNDTMLDKNARMSIITGPNMAGKSTYMRQVALIVLLAQMGSFVPARKAKIGVVDKIFTRIGASDDLAQGQSTFMLEMLEVSHILSNATQSSLIILDEIGRGTSTYDGMAIAGAVAECIAKDIKAKTMFATHYHELTELENKIEGVTNYSVVAEKRLDGLVFLHKIVKAPAPDSYGIEVAKLAGISTDVINRAYEILDKLEKKA
jgi:DNA mismatch repair protein MutS